MNETASSSETVSDFDIRASDFRPLGVTAKCEPSLTDAKPELCYQFDLSVVALAEEERLAYFALDADTSPASSSLTAQSL